MHENYVYYRKNIWPSLPLDIMILSKICSTELAISHYHKKVGGTSKGNFNPLPVKGFLNHLAEKALDLFVGSGFDLGDGAPQQVILPETL
ncbi:MAG: hypothetical protein GDA43_06375 [Hormoscilla sp. SP5CHS1]|nr:hypothetical protein [Hormoscilla sp. SP5CHS1]